MGHEGSDSALKNVCFGSVAGMSAKVFEHPFDLVKVRLQSQPTDRALTFKGPLDCFRKTYSKEGWRGLYRGLSAPIVGAACENACLFLVYSQCQKLILHLNPGPLLGGDGEVPLSEKARGKRRELSTPELALAAAGAGAAASFVLTPIELIKCRMQVQMLSRDGAFATSATSSRLPPSSTVSTLASIDIPSSKIKVPKFPPLEGPLSLIASTIRTSGIRGLWLGQMGTLFRETGGSSAWFTAFEVCSKYFLRRREALLISSRDPTLSRDSIKLTKADLKTWELVLSGAVAGMSYNLVLFPADSVKSAMQTAAVVDPSQRGVGFAEMAKRIWKTRGIRGLYAGCGLTVARAAPSSAMIFLIYESLEKRFGYAFE